MPDLPSLQIVFGDNGLALKGTITSKQPDKVLGAFFRAVHERVLAAKAAEFKVDVRALTFVNSSAIRLFIDWAIWVSQTGGPSYKLCFVRSPSVTWQRISFPPLAQLAGGRLVLEDGD